MDPKRESDEVPREEQRLWDEYDSEMKSLRGWRRIWRRLWRFRFLMSHDELAQFSEYEDVDRRVVRRLITRGNLLDLALRIETKRVKSLAALGLVLGTRHLQKEADKAGQSEERGKTTDPAQGASPAVGQVAFTSSAPESNGNESPSVVAGTPKQVLPPAFGFDSKEMDILEASVRYRIATTDLFVEKAQYYLEQRAGVYLCFAIFLFLVCMLSIGFGAIMALSNTGHSPAWLESVFPPKDEGSKGSESLESEANGANPGEMRGTTAGHAATETIGSDVSRAMAGENPPPAAGIIAQEPKLAPQFQPMQLDPWIELLSNFIRSFTAYGFLVLLAVMAARAAKACMDQREQLLTRRHSLRQGRLFLHLNGGVATVEELKVAFDWNHSQPNAFSHFDPEAKAPWGNVIEEIVKIIPEVAKATAAATIERSKPSARG